MTEYGVWQSGAMHGDVGLRHRFERYKFSLNLVNHLLGTNLDISGTNIKNV